MKSKQVSTICHFVFEPFWQFDEFCKTTFGKTMTDSLSHLPSPYSNFLDSLSDSSGLAADQVS